VEDNLGPNQTLKSCATQWPRQNNKIASSTKGGGHYLYVLGARSVLLRKSKRIFLYSLSAELLGWHDGDSHPESLSVIYALKHPTHFWLCAHNFDCVIQIARPAKGKCVRCAHTRETLYPRVRHLYAAMTLLGRALDALYRWTGIVISIIKNLDVDKHTCQHDEALVLF